MAPRDGSFDDTPAEARGLGLQPEDVTARIELTALGKAVADCWEAIPKYYPKIKIIGKRVMPDHFHGLLFVTEPLGCHLGQVIKGFKIGCNRAARALCPAIVSQGVGRGAQGAGDGGGLFAEGFTDVILFRDGQLENQINYLADNPRRLAVKTLFPELFTVADEIAVALPGLGPDARGRFAALGNRFLLKRPLAQVQVSRRFFGYRRVAKPGEKPMTRFDATAMNRLCQWLAGEDAAEINYHGMKPGNVDALAREAAQVG